LIEQCSSLILGRLLGWGEWKISCKGSGSIIVSDLDESVFQHILSVDGAECDKSGLGTGMIEGVNAVLLTALGLVVRLYLIES
jgi:hypothetical protein